MTTTKSLRAGAASQSLADDALYTGERALDSTRQFASQALERVGDKVRDLRYGAQEYASKGIDNVSETAAAAQQRLGRYADATTRYVSEQPVKSALIAAAVGAVVVGAVMAARRRRSSRY